MDVIKGLAMTAGSNLMTLASMGSAAPTSFAISTVTSKARLTTRSTIRVMPSLPSISLSTSQILAKQTIAKAVPQSSAVRSSFQIQDDILDVTSTTEELGKPVGSDDKNEKSTYVTLLGLDKAKEMVAFLSHRALDTLHTLPGQNPFLENLITYLITRGK